MISSKKARKRKQNIEITQKIVDKIDNADEEVSESEEKETNEFDLPTSEINNEDESSEEEAENVGKIAESDTEKDELLFESDDEISELELETDSEEEDDGLDSSEISESEDCGFETYSDTSDNNKSDTEESKNSERNSILITRSESSLRTNSDRKYEDSTAGKWKSNKNKKHKDIKPNDSDSNIVKSKSHTKKISVVGDSAKSEKETPNGRVNFQDSIPIVDEYEYDSSDEEDIRNTVGNVPLKWYDNYPHIGYDWDGQKILKPEKGDQLDNFLKRMEDPNFWRTIKDPQTGQDVILSEADIDLITRIQKQKVPDAQFDEYAPWVEWFTTEVMKTPLRKFPKHKRSFLPSKDEARKVSKLVHALKMGWIKSTKEMEEERRRQKSEPQFYMLWQSDDQSEEMRRIHKHIPAPKRFLPGHAESYNPPAEYLFDKKELKEFNRLKDSPWKRKLHFIPQKYDSLRKVPAYPKYIKERFQRCLDLYLCPRAIKMKLTIQPEDLVPQLPSPRDLQPFPTTMSMIYTGHTDMVRSISAEWKGQYFASGGDDMSLRIWEIATGRCVKVIPCGGVIRSVTWCPNQAISLVAVAADRKVLLINPGVGDRLITKKTDQLLEIIPQTDVLVPERIKSSVQWEQAYSELWKSGIRIVLNHFKTVSQVTWHGKGDYFASVIPEGQNRSVLIHQLTKRRSQFPFSKAKGLIQCVLFHPIKPFFFVANQRNVKIYDLVKQEMVKKLLANSQWISSMAIHPGGDNLLVGTYDRKVIWFDLDLSTKPYQTLRLHGTGVRSVAYHKRYPLFASGADDRGLIVCHGMVYNDLMQNPLIVPLKRLCNHEAFNDFGILDVMFHPIQPWIFSAGADATIRMYT